MGGGPPFLTPPLLSAEAPTFVTLRDAGRPSTAPRRPSLRPTAFSGGSLPKPAALAWAKRGGCPPPNGPVPPAAFRPTGCLNCSRVGELTARLATLEAQVSPTLCHPPGVRPPPWLTVPPLEGCRSLWRWWGGGVTLWSPLLRHPTLPSHCQVARLSVAEPPTSPAPKGSNPGRGPETGQLWGSPAAHGNPGDDGKAGSAGTCPPKPPTATGGGNATSCETPGWCQYLGGGGGHAPGGTPSWSPLPWRNGLWGGPTPTPAVPRGWW